MKVAIMQPTYLPWAGYFNMIAQCNLFIFLDDVQFAKRSWQQRNRIMLGGKEHFVSIPVQCRGKREQLIYETAVDDSQKWREKHISTLNHAYRKHPFGGEVIQIVSDCLSIQSTSLADITIAIIKAFNHELGLPTQFCRSSEIGMEGKRSEHLVALCQRAGATAYLSAQGSREYIEAEHVFADSGLKVEFHDFVPEPYPQKGACEFIPYLSIVDVVANLGFIGAKQLVTTAVRRPTPDKEHPPL